MNVHDIQREYDAACEAFVAAGDVMAERDMKRYEAKLRQAGIAASNAIEYGLKRYLETHSIPAVQRDYADLQSKTLGSCIYIVRRRSLLDSALRDQLGNVLTPRNDVSHDAYVPAAETVRGAITTGLDLLTKFLGMHVQPVPAMPQPGSTATDLAELRGEYLDYLANDLAYINLAGICAHADGEPIQIPIQEIVVPLRAVQKAKCKPNESERQPEPIGLAEILVRPRVVLLGDPGAGKSTASKYITHSIAIGAHAVAPVADSLPILVRASAYAQQSDLSFEDYLTTTHERKYSAIFAGALQKGVAIVLVDAMDEIADDAQRKKVANGIAAFAHQNRNVRIVVTSRKAGYAANALPPAFIEFEVSPLNSSDQGALLKALFRAMGSDSAEASCDLLMGDIRGNQAATELAANPLLLTILAVIHDRAGSIPESLTEVYRLLVETMTERWPKMQERLNFKTRDVVAVLEDAAFHMLESVHETSMEDAIGQSALRQIIHSHIESKGWFRSPDSIEEERDILLQRVEEVTGLLIRRDTTAEGEPLYGFAHLSIGEYLAATRAARMWKQGELWSAGFVLGPWWTNTLVLTAEILANDPGTDVGRFFLELAPRDPDEFIIYQLVQALEVIDASGYRNDDIRTGYTSQLLQCAVLEGEEEFWANAYECLAARPFSFDPCLEATHDDPAGVRVRKALLALLSYPDMSVDNGPSFDVLFAALAESEEGHQFFNAATKVNLGPFGGWSRGNTHTGFLALTGGPSGVWNLEDMAFDYRTGPCWQYPTLDMASIAAMGFGAPVDGFHVIVVDDGDFHGLSPLEIASSLSKTSTFWRELRDLRIGGPTVMDAVSGIHARAGVTFPLQDRFLCWQASALGEDDRISWWDSDNSVGIRAVLELQNLIAHSLEGDPADRDCVLDGMVTWGVEEAHWLTDDAVDSLRILLSGDSASVRHAAARVLAQTGRCGVDDVPAILQVWPDAYGVEPCHEGNLWTAEAFIRLTERDAKPAVAAQLSNLFRQSGFVRKMALQYNKSFTALSGVFVRGRVYRETGDATLEVSPCLEYADALEPLNRHEDPVIRFAAATAALLWLPQSNGDASTRRMWEDARAAAARELNP